MKEASVTQLVDAAEAFLVPLRMGEGLDEQALALLETAIDTFANQWRRDSMIPKSAASVLSEIWPSMEAASDLYPDERGDRIRDIAVRLGDRIAVCFLEDDV